MRKLLIITIILALGIQWAAAQGGNTSTVNIFFVACENQGVISFDGTMEPGFDIYYQLFPAAGGGGQALSSLRRVQVNGNYAVSDQLPYNGGQTLAAGSIGSARVVMARESNPASTIYETTVDDLQDGCSNPRNTLASSIDAGETPTTAASTGTIRSPYGGFLTLDVAPQPIVVIGAPAQPGRSNKPGEIFAECDNYMPDADPGIIYDTDNITIFWSWYARTPAQVQDHIDKAIYEVKFQTAPLLDVRVSPIEKLGRNYWVFYTAQMGKLAPGTYGVEFKLRWEEQTFDGYGRFGPDSDNESFHSTCTFEIKRDPYLGQEGLNFNAIYSVR